MCPGARRAFPRSTKPHRSVSVPSCNSVPLQPLLQTLAASFWFRALFPLGVGVLYELATRYAKKSEGAFDQNDWFIAIPAIGAAIVALPPLIALSAETARASKTASPDDVVGLGGFMLAALVILAFIVATFDRRVLAPRRKPGQHGKALLLTWLPNAFGIGLAAGALGIVGQ